MKIVLVEYRTHTGHIIERIFLKTKRGYKPCILDDVYLDLKENKILKETILENE